MQETTVRRCRCGSAAEKGERFCGSCGELLPGPATDQVDQPADIPRQRTGTSPVPAPTTNAPDLETTRLLCAAAHLDPAYADACIAEYLVEPCRPVVRTPGVDAAAVLGDVVAANARRRTRDGWLIALAVLTLITSWTSAVLWFLAAAGYRRFFQPSERRTTGRSVLGLLAITGALVVVALFLTTFVLSFLLLVQDGGLAALALVLVVVVLVLLLGVPTVLLLDAFGTYRVIRREFRRGSFSAEPHPMSTLRTWGRALMARRIDRLRAADRSTAGTATAEVVVFRGSSPFIGTGALHRRRAPVVPLKRKDGADKRPIELSEFALHSAIHRRIATLVRPSTLSPYRRLAGLRRHEQLLVDADQLVMHCPGQEAQEFLTGPDRPPVTRITSSRAQEHIRAPQEWARYYQLFQVEGWERDLTVSCHVTLGADAGLLYLEWALSVLPPVAEGYRQLVDDRRELTRFVLDKALTDLITFPLSLLGRARRLARQFRPLAADPGELVGAKYGAGRTLRELGAATGDDYFTGVDVARYTGIFDRAVIDAVRTHLEEQGLSVAEFDQIAQTIYSIAHVSGGNNAFGDHARAVDTSASPAPAPTSGGPR